MNRRAQLALDAIDDVLSSPVHFDESLEYELTTADFDWLEVAREAVEYSIPKFVACPKGWQGYGGTRYYCPTCKKAARQNELFCHNCGQSLKYPKIEYIKDAKETILVWE